MIGVPEDDTVKVIIVGDGYVGKTSLLRRFVRGDFTDQYRKTIGAEFLEKDVFLRDSNSTVKLMLWDTAGQEVFKALTQAYYRGAGAAVIVFSTVDSGSFRNVMSWKERVEAVCGPITMVLCQSKFDLSHEAAVTNEEAEGLAKAFKMPLYRVSSKDDFNVTQLFEFTAQQCLSAAGVEAGQTAAVEDLLEEPTTETTVTTVAKKPPSPAAAAATATPQSSADATAPAPSTAAAGTVPTPPVSATTAASSPTTTATAGAAAPAADAAAPSAAKDGLKKVLLTEPGGIAAADGKRKKKKKKCTLL